MSFPPPFSTLPFPLLFSTPALFPPVSPPCSTRFQGQQLVQPVKEVPERRQVSEYTLHLCQAGSRWCLFHHAHCLCTLLVALRERKEKKRKEVLKSDTSCTESAETKKSCHLRLKTGSLLLIRLCRHTTAHFVLTCPWMSDLNINDVIIHSFIISNYTEMC